jgi:hypothetical protein
MVVNRKIKHSQNPSGTSLALPLATRPRPRQRSDMEQINEVNLQFSAKNVC